MVFGTDEISHIWDRFGVFYIFGRDSMLCIWDRLVLGIWERL